MENAADLLSIFAQKLYNKIPTLKFTNIFKKKTRRNRKDAIAKV